MAVYAPPSAPQTVSGWQNRLGVIEPLSAKTETPFDLAKENEALVGTDAYWSLNDAKFG